MPPTIPNRYGRTLVHDKTGRRLDLYIARDDTTCWVESTYTAAGEMWVHERITAHECPTPHVARASMAAYERDMTAAGYVRVAA